MRTKQTVMRSAWSIFKMQNVTFSEALTLAWEKTKQGVKAVVFRANRLVKSAGLGYETIYFSKLTFVDIEIKRTVYNNYGAQGWYNGKTYNAD